MQNINKKDFSFFLQTTYLTKACNELLAMKSSTIQKSTFGIVRLGKQVSITIQAVLLTTHSTFLYQGLVFKLKTKPKEPSGISFVATNLFISLYQRLRWFCIAHYTIPFNLITLDYPL